MTLSWMTQTLVKSMSVSTFPLDRDEDSSRTCWCGAGTGVEGEISFMGITLMVPLFCTSSIEVRFINSFPNSASMNCSLKFELRPHCLCTSLTSSLTDPGSQFWKVNLWQLLSPRITLRMVKGFIILCSSLLRRERQKIITRLLYTVLISL